jgi:PucR C-terminal helix-turn-helix domain
MLMEWYTTDTARASVRDQLAPLEKLGPDRGEIAIRTLATYLDAQGPVARTAARLHLHRNAVAYRLQRITALLEVDLADPDQRLALALQLACRARLQGSLPQRSRTGNSFFARQRQRDKKHACTSNAEPSVTGACRGTSPEIGQSLADTPTGNVGPDR